MTIVNVGASEKDDVPVGAKVRVNKSVVVYHVPKTKGAATDLHGMEGEVAQRADDLDGTKPTRDWREAAAAADAAMGDAN